jgi:GT2 family glycosyltransferase
MTAASPRVVALILNRNRKHDTVECLASLAQTTYANIETVVLDNASEDGSPAFIRDRFPAVTIVETGGNLGYAAGNNVGLRLALARGADYALVLNEDTVQAPDCLAQLVAAAETHPEAAFFGPLVYHFSEPEVIQSAGGLMSSGWRFSHRGQNERDDGQYRSIEPVAWISGCALLIRMAALPSIGLFDEDFFLYCEELEWCVRAGEAGFSGLVVPAARLWHKGVRRDYQPSPRVTYLMARNHLLMLKKHRAGARVLAGAVAGNLRTLTSWTVRPRWRNRRAHRDALARAMVDFYRGSFGAPPL